MPFFERISQELKLNLPPVNFASGNASQSKVTTESVTNEKIPTCISKQQPQAVFWNHKSSLSHLQLPSDFFSPTASFANWRSTNGDFHKINAIGEPGTNGTPTAYDVIRIPSIWPPRARSKADKHFRRFLRHASNPVVISVNTLESGSNFFPTPEACRRGQRYNFWRPGRRKYRAKKSHGAFLQETVSIPPSNAAKLAL